MGETKGRPVLGFAVVDVDDKNGPRTRAFQYTEMHISICRFCLGSVLTELSAKGFLVFFKISVFTPAVSGTTVEATEATIKSLQQKQQWTSVGNHCTGDAVAIGPLGST